MRACVRAGCAVCCDRWDDTHATVMDVAGLGGNGAEYGTGMGLIMRLVGVCWLWSVGGV